MSIRKTLLLAPMAAVTLCLPRPGIVARLAAQGRPPASVDALCLPGNGCIRAPAAMYSLRCGRRCAPRA